MSSHKPKAKKATMPLPWFILLLVFFAVFPGSPIMAAADPPDAIIPLLEQMETSYARVNDYQAIFHKQERVEGKLLPEETILLKFQKPLKVYMKWIGEPLQGMEALYVQGNYENKLIAHRGGILGVVTLSLDPSGATAMKGNRHPITDTGFGHMIAELRRNIDRALRKGDIQIVRIGEEALKGRPATVVEARIKPGDKGEYSASHMVLYVDKEYLLPVSGSFYDEKDLLLEKYIYTDVKLNVGLTDMDFSRHSKEYRF